MDIPDLPGDIYTYDEPWQVFALAWSHRHDKPYRIAVGSFTDQADNRVDILRVNMETGAMVQDASIVHPLPASKVLFYPSTETGVRDLVATSGSSVRLFQLGPGSQYEPVADMQDPMDASATSAAIPLTSMDWNRDQPNLLVTSSLRNACSVWDVEAHALQKRIRAHDEPDYDVAWLDAHTFLSVGEDGQLRQFDLRDLSRAMILFKARDEYSNPQPLMRVSAQPAAHLAALLPKESDRFPVLDLRAPTRPLNVLVHAANEVAWAPSHAAPLLASAGDDRLVLVWRPTAPEAELQYQADGPVCALQWSALQPSWVAIGAGRRVQLLRV